MELPVSRNPGDNSLSSPSSLGADVSHVVTSSADDRGAGVLRQRQRPGGEGGGVEVAAPVAGVSGGEEPTARWYKTAIRASSALLILMLLDLGVASRKLQGVKHAFSGLEKAPLALRKGRVGAPMPVTDRTIKAACNSREQAAMRHRLKKIVLMVHCNYEDAAMQTTGFIRKVYGTFFKRIVFLSNSDIPEIGVQARGHKKWRGDWMYAYYHIPKIIAQYPDADGYLWTNDDVALNYWHLLKANKSKLWMSNDLKSPQSKFFPFDAAKPALSSDTWAGSTEHRETAWNAFKGMDDNYQKAYSEHILPLQGAYPKRIADTYYIPQRFAHAFSFDLLPIFRENKVWSDIGIPMIFYALDHPSHFDRVLDDMVNVEDWKKKFDPVKAWTPGISALHPFKVAQNSSKVSFLKLLGSVDHCLLRLLPELEEKFRY